MSDLLQQLREALAPQYEVERELASGGMGTVFVARDTILDRKVAVKVVHSEGDSETAARRLLNEARTLARFNHPNVVSIIHAGELGESFYYIMEYVEGETLEQRLKRGRLSADEAVRVGSDVLAALEAAHERGIVHRDVKPANVFLVENRALLGDFGIAKRADTSTGLTESGYRVGTPGYMAPEQAAGDEVTAATDIYALGMMLYEALTGRRWAVPMTPDAAPDWRGVPRRLVPVLKRALAWAPQERWADAAAFAGALSHAHGGRTLRPVAVGVLVVAAAITLVSGGRWLLVDGLGGGSSAPRSNFVAVAPFVNQTGDTTLDAVAKITAESIRNRLARTGYVRLVPLFNLMTAIGNIDEDAVPVNDPRRDVAIARETHAALVISGSFTQSGQFLEFDGHISDDRGRVVAELDRVVVSKNQWIQAAEQLSQQSTTVFAGMFDPILGRLGRVSGHLPDTAALREYLIGMDLYSRLEGSALEHFLKAAELDTTFREPLLWAALMYKDLRRFDAADSLLQAVYPYREELGPWQRHFLEAQLGFLHGDWSRTLEANRGATALLPPGARGFGLGKTAIEVNRPREAVEALLEYDYTTGVKGWGFNYWSFLTGAYHMLGDHQSELEAAQQARQLRPGRPVEMVLEVRALAPLGRIEEIRRRLVEAPTLSKAPLTPASVMEIAGVELISHGYSEAGGDAIARAIDWYRRQPPGMAEGAEFRYEFARALYLGERWDEAYELFRQLVDEYSNAPELQDDYINTDVHLRGFLAVTAARRGDEAEARRISEQLRLLDRRYLKGSNTYWRACIAAVLGGHQEAVDLLSDALGQGQEFWLPLAFPKWQYHADPDFASLRDYEPFIELLRPKG